MLAASTSARKRTSSTPAAVVHDVTGSNPPVITVLASGSKRHLIYGNIPMGRDGFELSRQSMHMLNYWHHRAIDECIEIDKREAKAKRRRHADVQLREELEAIQRVIIAVILDNQPANVRDVWFKMEAVARHALYNDCEISELVTVHQFDVLTDRLEELIRAPIPQRKVGPLRKGGRLTREGLLLRYYCFLLAEINTVGQELYGNAEYARSVRMEDSAVFQRMGLPPKPGSAWPIHRAHGLGARAKAVLESVRIDATRDLDAVRDEHGDIVRKARPYYRKRR